MILSKKPQAIYQFIVDYKQQNDGNSPTIREILRQCRVSSTSMVKYYLDSLVDQGLIQMTSSNGHRKIIVVGGSWELKMPDRGI